MKKVSLWNNCCLSFRRKGKDDSQEKQTVLFPFKGNWYIIPSRDMYSYPNRKLLKRMKPTFFTMSEGNEPSKSQNDKELLICCSSSLKNYRCFCLTIFESENTRKGKNSKERKENVRKNITQRVIKFLNHFKANSGNVKFNVNKRLWGEYKGRGQFPRVIIHP